MPDPQATPDARRCALPVCRKVLPADATARRRYCSGACRQAAWRFDLPVAAPKQAPASPKDLEELEAGVRRRAAHLAVHAQYVADPLAGSGKQAVALRVLPGLVDGLLAAHVAARRAAGDTWEHIGQVLEMHPDTVRRRFGQQQADTERREDLGDARLADPAGTSRPATVPDITTTSSPTSPRKQPIEEPAAGDGGSEVTPVDDQTGTETGTETGTDRPRDLRTVDRLGPDWATENDVLWWRRETRAGSVSPAWPGSGWTARNAQHTPITTGAGKRGAYSSRIKALTAVAADFEARRRAQTAHADVALEGAPEGWRLTQTQADMDRHRWNVVTPTGDVAGTVSKAGWHRQAWEATAGDPANRHYHPVPVEPVGDEPGRSSADGCWRTRNAAALAVARWHAPG
ncbi:hypothetical protein GCM10022224_080500 [Nonomuraea antimicrobica]|uniref:Uncharacterized protein n=1 Tax=Nonomuraea antimicrobica TaxID=561173 RepID=A0ABP7D934_9ACTN